MSTEIIVNTNDSRWTNTVKFGFGTTTKFGLGKPVTILENGRVLLYPAGNTAAVVLSGNTQLQQHEILLPISKLQELSTLFGKEIDSWASVYKNFPFSRAGRRQIFGRRLYDILYPANSLTDGQKDAYWGSTDSALGNLESYENGVEILGILNRYRSLISDILNLSAGLARTPQSDAPSPPPPSAQRVRVGTATKTLSFDFISIESVEIPLGKIIYDTARQLLTAKTLAFFDREREYKTVLNVGADQQYVVEAWRQGSTQDTIQLKLLEGLAANIQVDDTAYIARDVANTVIDIIEIEPLPLVDTSRQLRPYNMNVSKKNIAKTAITNFTLHDIEDNTAIYQQWYTQDYNSSELNIDFTNYNNFVMFGSAALRLQTFKNKLLTIENSLPEVTEYIIKNFDAYEQFLYHTTGSVSYSASVYYSDTGTEYNPIAYWPKQAINTPYAVSSVTATNWFATQSAIAQRFDEYNPNYLIKHLPIHIQEDAESQEFLIFVSMIGHLMDNIKVYIDQFPNIYSTSPDPLDELTMDQVYEVATSFGFNLPNAYALEQLQSFVSTVYNPAGGRTLMAETWKRFLHSAMYLSKAKGTNSAVNALMNVYGINSPLVQLKESAYPTRDNYVRSDELVYGVRFAPPSGSIQIPLVSASINTDTVQLRFIPLDKTSRTLLNGDANWAVDVIPHPSASKLNYGRLNVVSGSARTLVASSSYFRLFSDDYTHIMLRSQSQDLTIIQTDGDQILHKQIIASNIPSALWNATQHIYIGGSGSIQLSTFNGIVDEVLTWDENISNNLFERQAYDPGSYYGNTYSSSFASLYVHLGFSQPLHNITSSAVNESPYTGASSILLPTIGFTTDSYERFIRPVRQYVPVAGAMVYSNNKVTVAPPVDPATSLELSRTNSVKPLAEKKFIGGQDLISFAVSPIDFVNQNIMRTMGTVDTNYLIGSPRKVRGERYTEVDELYAFYLQKYNSAINSNEYIRFFKNVIYAPSEQVETMIPARASLVNGVVIESNILDRKRNNTLKAFRADGSGTKTFLTLINSESNAFTSSLAGAYSFDATYKLYPEEDTVTIPLHQQVYQRVNPSDVINVPATSSLISNGSGIAFVESIIRADPATANGEYTYYEGTIDYIVPLVTQSGYPRAPYLGILGTDLYPKVLDGEENTIIPFYDIPPRADFADVGVTTYFHKPNGIYKFPSAISKYKTELYRAKFTENRASPLDQVYAPLSLFPPDAPLISPSRENVSVGERRYNSGESVATTIKFAKLFSLIGIIGAAGLRIKLTRESDNVLIFDGTLDNDPDVNPYLLVQTQRGIITCEVINTTGGAIVSNVTFEYFSYDPLPLIPDGYLPRHYRFGRSTSRFSLRRSYLGCRRIYCDNGCPAGIVESGEPDLPWEIIFTGRSGGTVNNPTGPEKVTPTRTSDGGTVGGPITFGGRGPLGDE
jgi:hypothetical protein